MNNTFDESFSTIFYYFIEIFNKDDDTTPLIISRRNRDVTLALQVVDVQLFSLILNL